jgi:hypothetical protein
MFGKKEPMRIGRFIKNRGPAGWVSALGLLLSLTATASAQGTQEYRFTGQVSWFNPGSTVFPGVSVGSPVEGWFTIDYTVADSDPDPNAGSYSSGQVAFGGTIGGSEFFSVAHPGNLVRVADGQPDISDDWTILQVVPAGSLQELSLTFHDFTSLAIGGDALPSSAALFSAFPDFVLYARSAGGEFGQYNLNVAITQVPEPSVTVLGLAGLALLGTLSQRRRSAAGLASSNAEPAGCTQRRDRVSVDNRTPLARRA